ncbi:MAG: polysaccharide export outer membrane protein [Lentimonas sp.]|jgi:polysaccharide export outer membrane protein
MFKYFIILSTLAYTLFLGSCHTKEKLVYFQDVPRDTLQNPIRFETTFRPDDFISIQVIGPDPEVVEAFNLPAINYNNNSGYPQGNPALTGYTQGNPALTGYLIDSDGFVNLPVIGKIPFGGLTRKQVVSNLENKLSEYINSPSVSIQILNFKVTVLGDVSQPGTFKIPNERITVLEALGLAGDLNLTGVRSNVLLIREEDGIKKEYRIDLTKSDVFNSPYYFLRQNDVLYVEPNSAARANSTFFKSTGPTFISLVCLIITTITIITR